ncbi:MAG: hypothetical protein ACLFWL_08280 [Candidatus Brocadiia bacterium]
MRNCISNILSARVETCSHARRIFLTVLLCLSLSAGSAICQEDPFGDLLDEELQEATGKGDYEFVLVGPDGESIEGDRFLRSIPGQVSAREFPRVFTLAGKKLFTAGGGIEQGPDVGDDAVKIYCGENEHKAPHAHYQASCSADLPPGNYAIQPFGIEFRINGKASTRHPATTVGGSKLKIHTVPVTFAARVKGTKRLVPLRGLTLRRKGTNLLHKLVTDRQGRHRSAAYVPLTMYLPRGFKYESSLGNFEITATGKVQPLTGKERFEKGTFYKTVQPAESQKPKPVQGMWVVSRTGRRVFQRGETVLLNVIYGKMEETGKLNVLAQSGGQKITVGTLKLTPSEKNDARRILLDTGRLRPAQYTIKLDHPECRGLRIEIVENPKTTPLFLHSTACCNKADFTLDPAGLEVLQNAGIESVTQLGHHGVLSRPHRGREKRDVADGAPTELSLGLGEDERMLENMLRHGVGTVDYQNRRYGFSFEGLAFHHSYQPSVDRMVRRTQIFAQEFEDFPAQLGLTYTWFPRLGGYAEGTVIVTDPYFDDRMRALRKKIRERTGLTPLSRKEIRSLQQRTLQDEKLVRRWREYRRAEQRIGWRESFEHYNRELWQVDSDFIATTHENAGHDGGKLLRHLGGAHDAMSFESYTDFGDWPMSSGFTVDWCHGNITGKPVWLTVEGWQPEPAQCADAIYALSRGAEGIGIPMRGPAARRDNARRSAICHFLQQYGSIATNFQPDRTVAVLFNELQSRVLYHTHALHSHLMRLGYAPVVVSEKTIEESGVPDGVKAILIPNLRLPFSAECEKELAAFRRRGGKIAVVGKDTLLLEGIGCLRADVSLKQLWDIGGFRARLDFWKEFKKVRSALEKTMRAFGLKPRNGAAPEKALIIPVDSGGLNYVAVISSPLTAPDVRFEPVEDVKVEVNQAAHVVDLVTGQEIPVRDEAVTVDLVRTPAALLALLPEEIDEIVLEHPHGARAGEEIEFAAKNPFPGDKKPVRIPIRYEVTDSRGEQRAIFYRLSGKPLRYRSAENDPAGTYRVVATELIGGLKAEAKVKLTPTENVAAAKPGDDVFLPHPQRVPEFINGEGKIRVVVENTQTDYWPEARKIVEAFEAIGREAEIQRVRASMYDTLPLRWLPRSEDKELLEEIDAGEVVGYRGHMEPYIDEKHRRHIVERGGWRDIRPNYILRTHVVMFSGGRISESLSPVSRYMRTRNTPGSGQALIEVTMSPFWAGCDALTVVARDAEGARKGVSRLLDEIKSKRKDLPQAQPSDLATARADGQTKGTEPVQFVRPLAEFVPPSRCKELLTSRDGWTAAVVEDRVVAVSPDGKTTAFERPGGDVGLNIVNGGKFFCGSKEILSRHAAWHFPTAWGARIRTVDVKNGTMNGFEPPQKFAGQDNVIHAWEYAFAPSPDGKRYFAAEMGGGFFLYDFAARRYRIFRDRRDTSLFSERVRAPLCATGVGFSPDSRYLAYSSATFPVGHGNMGQAWDIPYASALQMVDLKEGKTLWRVDAEVLDDYSIAAQGKLRVTDSGRRVFLFNFNHDVLVFGAKGQKLEQIQLRGRELTTRDRLPDPVALEVSRDESTVLFAGRKTVLVTDADGNEKYRLDVPDLSDATLGWSGDRFCICDVDGIVQCYSTGGEQLWELETDGADGRVGRVADGFVVGEGAGDLLFVNPEGDKTRRVNSRELPPKDLSSGKMTFSGPERYRPPQTIDILKKYGSKRISSWTAEADGEKIYGQTFHPVDHTVKLQVEKRGPFVVRLRYRHEGTTKVTLRQGDKARTFVLDLPTWEYREVCLPALLAEPLEVNVKPGGKLKIALLDVYTLRFPGVNSAYVQPPSTDMGKEGGFVGPGAEGNLDRDLTVLDVDDSSSVADGVRGKMKEVNIYSNNIDPDRVQGPYFTAAGNPLHTFDGKHFLEGRPEPWTAGRVDRFITKMGSRIVIDLSYRAEPKICVTYGRTLTQSKVMRGIAVIGRLKNQFKQGRRHAAEWTTRGRCALAGVYPNDQFFRVFELNERPIEELAVFVFGGQGNPHGLSEIELYD